MTKLYLVRHGETEYNKKGCYYGWTDCSLATEGIEQAKALCEVFKHIEYEIILSSDLKRATETANIINCDSRELLIDSRLRELNFGKWEGLNFEEIMSAYSEHWNLWVEDWLNAVPTEGESIVSMNNRICEYIDEVLAKHKDKSIVIVSHNGALRIIAAYLLGLDLEKIWCFSFDHGKYSLLEIKDEHCVIKSINNI